MYAGAEATPVVSMRELEVSTVDMHAALPYTAGKITSLERIGDVVNRELVRSEPIWEQVVAVLRLEIIMGELPDGAHLKEPILARRFGVSRLPIREAIAQLDREHLVRILPRRGAFVRGLAAQDLSDIYECRTMIELAAVRRVAPAIEAHDVAELDHLVDQMDMAVASGQLRVMAAADMAFHRRVVDLSANRALIAAWEPLAPLVEAILSISDSMCAELPVAVTSHREITRALARHDTTEAVKIMTLHLPSGEHLVQQAIQSVREGRERRLQPA
jgi:GntR family transcriptional regulator of gluconate operon